MLPAVSGQVGKHNHEIRFRAKIIARAEIFALNLISWLCLPTCPLTAGNMSIRGPPDDPDL